MKTFAPFVLSAFSIKYQDIKRVFYVVHIADHHQNIINEQRLNSILIWCWVLKSIELPAVQHYIFSPLMRSFTSIWSALFSMMHQTLNCIEHRAWNDPQFSSGISLARNYQMNYKSSFRYSFLRSVFFQEIQWTPWAQLVRTKWIWARFTLLWTFHKRMQSIEVEWNWPFQKPICFEMFRNIQTIYSRIARS